MPGSASRILVDLNITRNDWLSSKHLLLTVLKSGAFKHKAPAGPVVRFLGNTFHCTILAWQKRGLSGSLFSKVFNQEFRRRAPASVVHNFQRRHIGR